METNTYQKFNQSIEKVFENVEDMDLSLDVGEYCRFNLRNIQFVVSTYY